MDSSSAAGLRGLHDPLTVIAFGGWNDAGAAASDAVDHLADAYDAEIAYSLEPDDFYDFQVNRPEIEIIESGVPGADSRVINWPTTEISHTELPSGRDLLLIEGFEPNLRWRQFCTLLTSALTSAGVRRAYLLGSLLADSPHTRPIPVSVSTSDPKLAAELNIEPSTYEGPTGILGVLGDSLQRAGIEVVSLWAQVPHYVSRPPCPKGSLALLTRLEDLTDVAFDLGELPELARAWERGVDELAAEDSEVADYVSALEHQRDETELPEASGDAIAAEFERYLRRRRDS